MSHTRLSFVVCSLFLTTMIASVTARAAEEGGTGEADSKKVEVERLRKQYWRQQSDFDVVQNRIYSKAGRAEAGLFGGLMLGDPFLSVKNVGGVVGFHFNEYFSVHALGWKSISKDSSALEEFRKETGRTTNFNAPKSYFGGELSGSLIYGKLSLLGYAISYFDTHLLGGVGSVGTETGNYLGPSIGIGQQFHVSNTFSLRLDYRFMRYQEDITERYRPGLIGQKTGNRVNFTSVITLGLSAMVF